MLANSIAATTSVVPAPVEFIDMPTMEMTVPDASTMNAPVGDALGSNVAVTTASLRVGTGNTLVQTATLAA